MRHRRFALILASLALAFFIPRALRADDDKPIRALFVCGGCCHDYLHQKDIIPKGISARANVEWTIAYERDGSSAKLNPIYENPDWAKGFDIIVHDECSSEVKDLAIIERILKPHKEGLPGVVLHCGMHCYRSEGWPKVVTPWFEFTGLQTTGHRAQEPIAITYVDKESPITKGLEDWTTIKEELYNNIAGHVLETAHPLARGKQSYKEKNGKPNDFDDVVTWTNTYNGKTRVFCTTIGHNNDTCADAKYLDLVTRGLLWSVNKLDDAHMKPAKKVYMDGAEPKEPPKTPAKTASPKADANGMVPFDLARGKVATASSHQGEERLPGAALDGDGDSRWCAANASFPQWWQVDLGKAEDLIGCTIVWEKDNTAYQFKVEGSADGKTWLPLADETKSTIREQISNLKFEGCCGSTATNAAGVRYVRITVNGSNTGAWASFFDVEIYGKKLVPASSQPKAKPATSDPKRVAGGLKPPAGFDLTVFAAPPDVSYVTALSAAPNGDLYVGIDEDGSLGHLPDKGRVVKAVDTTGSGKADKFTTFAKMDHPRGLIWDDGKLFVLHPPFLSVYYDDNGTGVSNRSEILVKGISTESLVASRGADHTTNGIRMGIDGWIYIATGDFGCLKAVGKDGTELTFHHGGVLRVRPDGSNLEVYCYGTRNIYDVAIDPLMNVFTRDNTNDGDKWNDRLAYDIPTGNYGYPNLFLHFPGEFVNCLADYGGGSPCGSLFLDEPGLPGGLYTVEWGNSVIDHHPLTPDGANFKADRKQFMALPRGTDMDVDGQSRLYASSWANGGFSFSGPNVGYVVRLTPKDYTATPLPDLRKATDEEILKHLTSPSHTRRLATSREILRRGDKPALADGLQKLAASSESIAVRAAAIFTLRQLRGDKANDVLAELSQKADVREFALRALCDSRKNATVPITPFIAGLSDANPRVRLLAAWGLGRLGHGESAAAVLPLTADADFLVSHVATQALVAMNAQEACLKAVAPSTTPPQIAGALGVLQQLHDPQVVAGLIERIGKLEDPAIRSQAYGALCRLCFIEAEWDGKWWGTRPDTTGPYYKGIEWTGTEAVKAALQKALASEKPQVLRNLIVSLEKNKIALPGVSEMIAGFAASDPAFQELLVDMLATSNQKLTTEQTKTLRTVAGSEQATGELRANAIRALLRDPPSAEGLAAAADTLAPLLSASKVPGELSSVLDSFIREPKFGRESAFFARLAESESPAKRELAFSVLMNLAGSRLVKPNEKAAAVKVIDAAWSKPANTVALLHAAGRMHADAYKDKVSALLADPKPEVAAAAGKAADELGLRQAAGAGHAVIETMKYEEVLAAVQKEKGDIALGSELFKRQGCIACHTTSAKEPPKGPMLAGISGRYNRAELCESILKPSAKISQGFETQWFKTADGDVVEGFVVREGGDDLELRNPAGISLTVKKKEIKARGKRDISMMPEALAAKLTPQELASLLAYLESLKGN